MNNELSKPFLEIGNIKIWRIVENEVPGCIPTDTFPNIQKQSLMDHKAWLQPHYLDENTNFFMTVQSFLIQNGDKLILVDGCIGNHKLRHKEWTKNLNTPFLDRMKEIGFSTNDIDIVLCTHIHVDHVGWFTQLKNDTWQPTFPNAEYIVVEEEFNFWKSLPVDSGFDNLFAFVDSVIPVYKAGLVKLVPDNYKIGENIYFESARGHTPAQVMIHIESEKQHGIIIADVLHHPIQVAEPEICA